ncbi:MAG: septal ring lytic transglycosylase RlpA family protein [Gammaproteobacteria bacterium]
MRTRQLRKILLIGLVAWALLILCSCSSTRSFSHRDGAPSGYVDVTKIHNAVPRAESISKYGNPTTYVVDGVRYHVLSNASGYNKVGLASWYGTKFHGQLTSSREPYNMYSMTAASCTLPIPTYVRVTNLQNGKSVIVKVNDRGPFKSHRLIDLSYVAAKKLGYAGQGTTLVRVTALNASTWAKNSHASKPQPTIRLAHAEQTYSAMASNNANRIYLQVGAFHSLHNAEHLKQEVQHFTHAPIAIYASHHLRHSPIYRVQIGPLPKTEFAELRQQLADHGLGHIVSVMA